MYFSTPVAAFAAVVFGDAAAAGVSADRTLARRHRQLHVRRELHRDRIAVVLLHLHFQVVHEQEPIVTEHVGRQGQRLEVRLIHEVIPVSVRIEERRRHLHQIGFGEFLAGLERAVEHGAGQEVAHLDAHERLATPGRRLRDVDFDAVIRGVFVLEVRLSFDLDRFYQGSHPPILTGSPWSMPGARAGQARRRAARHELEGAQRVMS